MLQQEHLRLGRLVPDVSQYLDKVATGTDAITIPRVNLHNNAFPGKIVHLACSDADLWDASVKCPKVYNNGRRAGNLELGLFNRALQCKEWD